MAAEEQTKFDFTEILRNIDRKFEIIHTKWIECKHFEVKFRTQIPRDSEDFNELCDEWVDIFSRTTNTVWVKTISNTGPKIRFRKQYQCWTHGGTEVQKELLFDARKCKATIDVKVLTDNPQTRKKNKHLKLGLNVVVKINFIHLHPVNTTKKYAFFVHKCEPQPEAPRPNIQPNDRLPQLVADMVQKGLNSTAKASLSFQQNSIIPNTNTLLQQEIIKLPNLMIGPIQKDLISTSRENAILLENTTDHSRNSVMQSVAEETMSQAIASESITMLQPVSRDIMQVQHDHLLENSLHTSHLDMQTLESTYQIPHLVPLQNLDSIKLEAPQFHHVTQVLVSESDMGEQILLCQPTIMLDSLQVLPVSGTSLSSQFVQLNSSNIHSQQGFL